MTVVHCCGQHSHVSQQAQLQQCNRAAPQKLASAEPVDIAATATATSAIPITLFIACLPYHHGDCFLARGLVYLRAKRRNSPLVTSSCMVALH
jgi:hypothetical protein